MIKALLKQTSFIAVSLMICSITAQGGLLNANSTVGSTKFLSTDQGMDDVLEFAEELAENGGKWSNLADMVEAVETAKSYADIGKEISNIGNKYSKEAKNSISKAKKEASDSLSTFEQGAYGMMSTFSADAMEATADGLEADIKKKAKDIATGKELLRGINTRVTGEMKEMGRRTPEETGSLPTLDPANLAVGMYNLDSVFGANMENGGIRKEDTKMCSGMGLKDVKPGEPLGLMCCLKWIMDSGEEPADSGSTAKAASAIAICCAIAPDYCLSLLEVKAGEKAACVNGALESGSSAEKAWKTCGVECGEKGYGALVHNDNGKYDPKQVEDLMKECYNNKETTWQPSSTVLTASELAPVVPDDVKNMLK